MAKKKCEFCGSTDMRVDPKSPIGTVYKYLHHHPTCMSLTDNKTRALIRMEEMLENIQLNIQLILHGTVK